MNSTDRQHHTFGTLDQSRTDREKDEDDAWHFLYLHRTHLGPVCRDNALILCVKSAVDMKRPQNRKTHLSRNSSVGTPHTFCISSYRCKHPNVVKHRLLIPTGWVWKTQNLTPFKVNNTNCHICIVVIFSAGSTAERVGVRLTDRDRCSHPAPLPTVNTLNVIILQLTQTTQMFVQ